MARHILPTPFTIFVVGYYATFEKQNQKSIFLRTVLFSGFRGTLDRQMKILRSTGHGVQAKQAEPLTIDEEDQLWKGRYLGDHSSQVLLDTMLYLCGICFAMRSGEEHRNLKITQFQLVKPKGSPSHLIYYENYSKYNSSHRKVPPKQVVHYENQENSTRYLVRLYKKYLSYHPETEETAFYLTPLKKPKSNVWYSKVPVGHNTLAKTVHRICESAQILGYKMNHSLHVTSATRLFQKGVDEQLIMCRTGHRSIDGVRTEYKRISENQHVDTSNIFNSCTNGVESPQAICLPPSSKKMLYK